MTDPLIILIKQEVNDTYLPDKRTVTDVKLGHVVYEIEKLLESYLRNSTENIYLTKTSIGYSTFDLMNSYSIQITFLDKYYDEVSTMLKTYKMNDNKNKIDHIDKQIAQLLASKSALENE